MSQIENMSVDDILQNFKPTPKEEPVLQQSTSTPQEQQPPVSEAPVTMDKAYDLGDVKEQASTKSVDEILKERSQAAPGNTEEQHRASEDIANITEGHYNDNAPLTDAMRNQIAGLIDSQILYGFEDDIYETVGDLRGLIEANKSEWKEDVVGQVYEGVQNSYYENKSPLWKNMLHFAENASSMEELEGLRQAGDNVEYSASLNENIPEHQEEIVRAVNAIQGLSIDHIESEVQDLRERGRLEEKARALKPILDKYNLDRYEEQLAVQQQAEAQKQEIIDSHVNGVSHAVWESEDIGGIDMSEEDRNYVYSSLMPSQELGGGLPIYSMVDNLLSMGDFETLSKVALLMLNPQGFDNYYESRYTGDITNDLQRKLRTSFDSNPSVSQNPTQEQTQSINRMIDPDAGFTLG